MQRTILPDVVLSAALRSSWLDAVCRLRSIDLVHKSKLHQFLPRTGLILDLGCGLGHVSETVLKDAPGRECVMVDPVWSPTPKVSGRLGTMAHFIKADGTS